MFHVKLLLLLLAFTPFFCTAQHTGTTKLEVKNLPIPPKKIEEIAAYINSSGDHLTDMQKEWFYWTNYSRSNPKRFWDSVVDPILKVYPSFRNSYTNSLKEDLVKSPQLPLFIPNKDLAKAAQTLADDLASKKAGPSHTSPNGATFQDRMQLINVKKCAGENISFGPPNTVLMLVLLYIDDGVPDHGHRNSLLNSSFVEMGIGIGAYPENKFMIVQDFACSQK